MPMAFRFATPEMEEGKLTACIPPAGSEAGIANGLQHSLLPDPCRAPGCEAALAG